MANILKFQDAEKARANITNKQIKDISALYRNWAKELSDKAKEYERKGTPSSVVQTKQMKELRKYLNNSSKKLNSEIKGKITNSIYLVADNTVKSNISWLKSLGIDTKETELIFNNVPDNIVRKLVTGQIYEGGWSLSKAIWKDEQITQKDLYTIVAKGLAQNQPIYEIANELSTYVNPDKKLDWNLKMADGKRIYKRKVDYNAQRLARTLAQHSYQQSFNEIAKDNPFIEGVRWNANGSRACEVCKARHNKIFKKDEVPMDHPNGMCVLEPVLMGNGTEDIINKLADWVYSEDGDNPEIDKFAKNFGYEGVVTGTSLSKSLPTQDEVTAVKEYTTGSYNGINSYLRNGYSMYEDTVKELVKNIDNFLEKSPRTKTDRIVFRGTRPEELGFSGKMNEASAASLERTLKREGLINKGYLSTSTEELSMYNNGVIMNIKILKGAKAADVSKLSGITWEKEVLIPRGVKLDVESVVYDKKKKAFIVNAIYR